MRFRAFRRPSPGREIRTRLIRIGRGSIRIGRVRIGIGRVPIGIGRESIRIDVLQKRICQRSIRIGTRSMRISRVPIRIQRGSIRIVFLQKRICQRSIRIDFLQISSCLSPIECYKIVNSGLGTGQIERADPSYSRAKHSRSIPTDPSSRATVGRRSPKQRPGQRRRARLLSCLSSQQPLRIVAPRDIHPPEPPACVPQVPNRNEKNHHDSHWEQHHNHHRNPADPHP